MLRELPIMIGEDPLLKPLIDIPAMANTTVQMLHDNLEAFVNSDLETAKSIPGQDNKVDSL